MTVPTFPQPPAADDRVLLRELNHRINNELAFAIELVSAGAVLADNPEVKSALSKVVELLHGYADVHRALMIPVCNVLVDAAECLRRLGRAMSRSRLNRLNMQLVFAAETLPLESDRCWRLGLIVQELVADAARQASINSHPGEIRIELKRSGPLATCTVSDNGSGSAGAQPEQSLGIVRNLAKSLRGHADQDPGPDSRSFVLVFPLTEREQRANAAAVWRERRAARRRKSARSSARRTVAGQRPGTVEGAPSQLHQP